MALQCDICDKFCAYFKCFVMGFRGKCLCAFCCVVSKLRMIFLLILVKYCSKLNVEISNNNNVFLNRNVTKNHPNVVILEK